MERQERMALLLLIVVMGVVSGAHVVLTLLGNGPFAAPYAADVREGRLVVLEGEIERITTTNEGGHQILQVQGVQVFIPASVATQRSLQEGERVQIYGVVQMYRGQREVLVSRATDVTIR